MNKQIEAVAEAIKEEVSSCVLKGVVDENNEHTLTLLDILPEDDTIDDIIEFAVFAAIKAYQESAWQDISEAPKDGSVILACIPERVTTSGHKIEAEINTVRWLWHDELNNRGAWHRGGGFDFIGATHFQHIQPPKPKGETE